MSIFRNDRDDRQPAWDRQFADDYDSGNERFLARQIEHMKRPLPETRIMDLWREAGLPEWFLGNGGTNEHLREFVRLVRNAKA